MRYSSLFALALALTSCASLAPPPAVPHRAECINPAEHAQLEQIRQAFDGHPPVEVLDLEAAPDSIATVEAEYWMGVARKRVRKL